MTRSFELSLHFDSRPSLGYRVRCNQRGFTLVELIAVMVIIGIVALGSTLFIGQAVTGVSDAAERQQVSSIAWVISEKISRDLRRALPNSVRIGSASGLVDNCIEFVPTVEGTYYRSVPVGVPGTSAEVIDFERYNSGSATPRDRLAVFPRDNIESYSLSNPGPISPAITSLAAGSLADTTTINFGSSFAFENSSPQNRIYVVREPVSYCFSAGVLRRYSEYGFQSSFNFSALANPVVIASEMQFGQFQIDASSLITNSTISVRSQFLLASGAQVDFDQKVQVRNAP